MIDWRETNQRLRILTDAKGSLEREISRLRPEVERLEQRLAVLKANLIEFGRQYADLVREQEQLLSRIRRELNRREG